MEATANIAPRVPAGNGSAREQRKQSTDQLILTDWIAPGARVLDLGCGRGLLLEHLQHAKQADVVGVDSDLQSVIGCVERGVPAYQGDILEVLNFYPDRRARLTGWCVRAPFRNWSNPGKFWKKR